LTGKWHERSIENARLCNGGSAERERRDFK
jgi:hypothetical protein